MPCQSKTRDPTWSSYFVRPNECSRNQWVASDAGLGVAAAVRRYKVEPAPEELIDLYFNFGGSCVIRITSIHKGFKGFLFLSPQPYPQKEKHTAAAQVCNWSGLGCNSQANRCAIGTHGGAQANPSGLLSLGLSRARNDPQHVVPRKYLDGGGWQLGAAGVPGLTSSLCRAGAGLWTQPQLST